MPTFTNDANGNTPLYYVATTLGANDGTGFQQQVVINSNTYNAYLASNLANVCFQDGAGNLIQSWLESGETNSSTSTIYWVVLPNSSITVVYYTLVGTSLNSMDGVTTGAEPKYTGTYGQYDNGASIFTIYENFAGVSIPLGWSSYGSITQNNGLSVGSPYGNNAMLYNTPQTGGLNESLCEITTGNNYNFVNFSTAGAGPPALCWGFPNVVNTDGMSNGVHQQNGTIAFTVGVYQIFSAYYVSGVSGTFFINYGTPETLSTYPPSGGLSIGFGPYTQYTNMQWTRMRTWPTGGTMPSQSFGSITPVGGGPSSTLNNWF